MCFTASLGVDEEDGAEVVKLGCDVSKVLGEIESRRTDRVSCLHNCLPGLPHSRE